jgi:hypothetical protein
MKKSIVAVLAACGLAAGCLGVVGAAGSVVDDAQYLYPNSLRVGTEFLDPAVLRSGKLRRQMVFQTAAERATVTQWYAERLHVSPASTSILTGGECSQVRQSETLLWIGHTVEINLCDAQSGTRIVVNEAISFWP